MGSPNDMNEMEFSCEVGKIISQLEIYDHEVPGSEVPGSDPIKKK